MGSMELILKMGEARKIKALERGGSL